MINKKILSILIVVAIFFVNTASASAWSLSKLLPKYSVSGKIMNMKMEPIEGAQITFESNERNPFKVTTTTDVNGNYSTGVLTKNVWVTVIKDGGYSTIHSTKYITNGTTLNFILCPDKYTIRGKIMDENGEPIQDVKISIERDDSKGGIWSSIADETGSYFIEIPTGINAETDVGVNVWVTLKKDEYKTYRKRGYISKYNTIWDYTLQTGQ